MKNRYSTFLIKCAAILMTGSLLSGCGPASEPAVPVASTEDVKAAEVTEAADTETEVTETEVTEPEITEAEATEAATTEAAETAAQAALADGTYVCDFITDSSMFAVNEACEGKGLLTVKDGQMTIHVSLMSEKILNLFPGLAEDAMKDGAVLLEPVKDTVTYSDGTSDTVNGFDVPVPAIDEEFDLAIIGTKGKWYDHKVKVSAPVEGDSVPGLQAAFKTAADLELADGVYTAEVTLKGGSGRASVTSPAIIKVENGTVYADIEFSSANYDYMLLDGTRYEADTSGGLSVFEVPIAGFDSEIAITADTTAMSEPHEIDYTVCFDSASIKESK